MEKNNVTILVIKFLLEIIEKKFKHKYSYISLEHVYFKKNNYYSGIQILFSEEIRGDVVLELQKLFKITPEDIAIDYSAIHLEIKNSIIEELNDEYSSLVKEETPVEKLALAIKESGYDEVIRSAGSVDALNREFGKLPVKVERLCSTYINTTELLEKELNDKAK